MGDYPIWVNDARVDSPAVLSTVLNICALFPRASQALGLDRLHAVTHRHHESYRTPTLPVPVRPCVDETCHRCEHKIGGYAFRWTHLLFRPYYDLNRREQARPMEPVIGLKEGVYALLFQCQWFGRDLEEGMEIPRSMPAADQILTQDPAEREALLRMPIEAYAALDEEMQEESEIDDFTTGWTEEQWQQDAELDDIPHRLVRYRNLQ